MRLAPWVVGGTLGGRGHLGLVGAPWVVGGTLWSGHLGWSGAPAVGGTGVVRALWVSGAPWVVEITTVVNGKHSQLHEINLLGMTDWHLKLF